MDIEHHHLQYLAVNHWTNWMTFCNYTCLITKWHSKFFFPPLESSFRQRLPNRFTGAVIGVPPNKHKLGINIANTIRTKWLNKTNMKAHVTSLSHKHQPNMRTQSCPGQQELWLLPVDLAVPRKGPSLTWYWFVLVTNLGRCKVISENHVGIRRDDNICQHWPQRDDKSLKPWGFSHPPYAKIGWTHIHQQLPPTLPSFFSGGVCRLGLGVWRATTTKSPSIFTL